MIAMHAIDRVGVGALAGADVGVGLYLIGAAQDESTSWLHALVGVVGLLLAMPAFVAALTGRLPRGSAGGVLVNIGVLSFMTLEMVFLPGELLERIGWSVFVGAATAAAIGWYFRVFDAERRPPAVGRHQ